MKWKNQKKTIQIRNNITWKSRASSTRMDFQKKSSSYIITAQMEKKGKKYMYKYILNIFLIF